MSRPLRIAMMLSPVIVAGCASAPDKNTLADLRNVQADTSDVRVEQGLDNADECHDS
jgi:cellulose synthase operon protein C